MVPTSSVSVGELERVGGRVSGQDITEQINFKKKLDLKKSKIWGKYKKVT